MITDERREAETGYLVWDERTERPDIQREDDTFHGGLHSGDELEVHTREGYPIEMPIEYDAETGSWYILGIPRYEAILGLKVRRLGRA